MPGIHDFPAFLTAGILLNLTPGNDTIYIVSRSLAQGRRAGILSALGIGTGSIGHTLLAAFGLSVLLARSLFIFNIVKYAGAAYLVFVGVLMVRRAPAWDMDHAPAAARAGQLKVYRQAVFTNLLNPKVAMFYLAFLPQFVEPVSRHAAVPFIILGLTFTFTGTVWCLILALMSSRIQSHLMAHENFSRLIRRCCGAVLVGLGVRLAFTSRS